MLCDPALHFLLKGCECPTALSFPLSQSILTFITFYNISQIRSRTNAHKSFHSTTKQFFWYTSILQNKSISFHYIQSRQDNEIITLLSLGY